MIASKDEEPAGHLPFSMPSAVLRFFWGYTWQLLSIASYFGAMYFQDVILQKEGKLSDWMAFLALFVTTLICYKGRSCFQRSRMTLAVIAGVSLITTLSTVLTYRGQAGAGIIARLVFKSSKIIPTTIIEALVARRQPPLRKVLGCSLLTFAGALYFLDTASAVADIPGFTNDTDQTTRSYNFSVLLLLGAAILDSSVGVAESHFFFRENAPFQLTVPEVAFGCASWSVVFLLIGGFLGGFQLSLGTLSSFGQRSMLIMHLSIFCILAGTTYILTFHFISALGPSYNESFKVFRKMLVMLLFTLVAKNLPSMSATAALLFCCLGLWLVETTAEHACTGHWLKSVLSAIWSRILQQKLPLMLLIVGTTAIMAYIGMPYLLLPRRHIAFRSRLPKERYRVHANISPCIWSNVTSEYLRHSWTPMLMLRNSNTDIPCGVIKLSCRIRSNTPSLVLLPETKHDNWYFQDWSLLLPPYDRTWADLLTQLIFQISPTADRVMVPGSGLVIEHASKLFGKEAIGALPETCIWDEDVIRGYFASYVSGIEKVDISASESLAALNADSQTTLATFWIADAATEYDDRSSKACNIFTNGDHLVPLDFEGWLDVVRNFSCSQQAVKEAERNIAGLMSQPEFMKDADAHASALLCMEDGLYPVLQYVLRIMQEICEDEECSAVVAPLTEKLLLDPWIGYERLHLQHPEIESIKPMCCDLDIMTIEITCKKCPRQGWQYALDIRLDESCTAVYDDVIDFFAAVVKQRLSFVYRAATELNATCILNSTPN